MNTEQIVNSILSSPIFTSIGELYKVIGSEEYIIIVPEITTTPSIISDVVIKQCIKIADDNDLMIYIRSSNNIPQIVLHP